MSSNFSLEINNYMNNIQKTLIDPILSKNNQERVERAPVHHHHHHHCHDYWISPFHWPNPIYIFNNDSSKKDKDYIFLAVISTVAFLAFSYLCGNSYNTYSTCLQQHQEHKIFQKNINQKYFNHFGKNPNKQLYLERFSHLTKELLDKKYNDACSYLTANVASLITASFLAIGAIFKTTALLHSGFYLILPVGFYQFFHWGYQFNDHSESTLTKNIQDTIEKYNNSI